MSHAPHEIMILALKANPSLLTELLSRLGYKSLPDSLTPVDSTLRFADVKEVRPDIVFTSSSVPWIIAEVQHKVAEDKRRTWPLAVSVLVNEHRQMGELVVLTSSRAVAQWAQTLQWSGPLGSVLSLRPLVLWLNLHHAEQLSERMLEELNMNIDQIPESKAFKKFKQELFKKGLEEGKLKGLEEGKLKGLEEGKLKGLEEGKLKGLEEGQLKGLLGSLQTILKAQGLEPDSHQLQPITSCKDTTKR